MHRVPPFLISHHAWTMPSSMQVRTMTSWEGVLEEGTPKHTQTQIASGQRGSQASTLDSILQYGVISAFGHDMLLHEAP